MRVFMHYLAPCPGGPIKSRRRVVNEGGCQAILSPDAEYRIACKPGRTQLGVCRGRGRDLKLVDAAYAFATAVMFRPARAPDGEEFLQELITCPQCRTSELYRRDEEQQRSIWLTTKAQEV